MAESPFSALAGRLSPMLKQRLPLLLVAVLVMSLTGILIRSYLADKERALERLYQAKLQSLSTERTTVIVAAQDIPADTVLKPSMFQEMEIPVPYRQPYAVTTVSDLFGQQTIANIAKGEQVMQTKLTRVGGGRTLADKTPPGHRAVTFGSGTFSSIPAILKPGDQIDIMWTFPLPQRGGGTQPVTAMLFQRITILAIGTDLGGGGRNRSSEEAAGAGITLALTPQETELLFLAQGLGGRLYLALRPQTDKDIVQLPPTFTDTLLNFLLPQAFQQVQRSQEAAPPQARSVEIFRGLQRETVTVPLQTAAASVSGEIVSGSDKKSDARTDVMVGAPPKP